MEALDHITIQPSIEPSFGLVGVGNNASSIPTDVIIFMAVDTFIILATLAGNILTICAIRLSRKLSALLSNWFIFSLALSDLMVGLTVPYHLAFAVEARLGVVEGTCILRFVLTILACSSSIMNLLVIATDRYMAIVYPLHYCRYMTKTVAMCLISVSWMSCFAVATIPIYWNTWRERTQCTIDEVLPDTYFNFLLTPLFVSVWLAMFLLYIRIWKEASENSRRLKSSSGGQSVLNAALSESRSVQVVLLILGCFSISWLPYFIIITYNRVYSECTSPYVYEAAFTLAVANSCMNPLIYAWKNSNFREAFRCLLRCRSPRSLHQRCRGGGGDYVTNHEPIKASSVNTITLEAGTRRVEDAGSKKQHKWKSGKTIRNGREDVRKGSEDVELEKRDGGYLDHEQHSDVTVTTSMHGSAIVD